MTARQLWVTIASFSASQITNPGNSRLVWRYSREAALKISEIGDWPRHRGRRGCRPGPNRDQDGVGAGQGGPAPACRGIGAIPKATQDTFTRVAIKAPPTMRLAKRQGETMPQPASA